MGWEVEQVAVTALDLRYQAVRLKRPEVVSSLARSIASHGVLEPVVANRMGPGAPVLLDGFKRVQILGEQGQQLVPCRIVHLDEAQARAAILAFNAPHRGLCELEEAWLVHGLCREMKLTQVQVAELLGRHKSWVCRRLALAERLAEPVQDDMRLGLVSATMARELARLPRGNQAQTAESIRQHGLSTRQGSELVTLLLACDDAKVQRSLLQDPLAVLSKRNDTPVQSCDPRLSEDAQAVRRAIQRAEPAVTNCSMLLRRHRPSVLHPNDIHPLQEAVSALSERAEALRTDTANWLQLAGHEEDDDVGTEKATGV